MADTAAQPVVAFKKRKKRTKKGARLNRKQLLAKQEEDEDDDLDEEDEAADGYDPKVGGLVTKDKLALLDAQYTGATKTPSENENPHLLKYLDEKLNKGGATSPQARKKSEYEKLYELSDDMKAARSSAKGEEVSEDKALGGAVAFGTGIAEVELPIDYQLENIERTELAKSEFIKRQNSRRFNHRHDADEMDGHGTGGNYGSNFRQHNRDFKKRKREEFRRFEGRSAPGDANIICHNCNKPGHRSTNCPQNGGGGGGGGGGNTGGEERRPRLQMASDDIMMRRFWTRMRNQRRM